MILWTAFIPITALFFIVYFDKINVISRGKKSAFKIDDQNTLKATKREVKLTLLSLSMFAAIGLVMDICLKAGYGAIYNDYHFGLLETLYLIASFFIALAMHDLYFYATHRLLHSKLFFNRVHAVHHKSHNPNAWSAFSFHPIEGLFQIGILPLIFFFLPIHSFVFGLFTILLLFISVYGHCGCELRPNKVAAFHMFNTSLHHYQHHQFVRYNFGLYLNTWDKLFKSNYPKYEESFEKLRDTINAANRAQ